MISISSITTEPEEQYISIGVPKYQIGDTVSVKKTIMKDGVTYTGETVGFVCMIDLYDGKDDYRYYMRVSRSYILPFVESEVLEHVPAQPVKKTVKRRNILNSYG